VTVPKANDPCWCGSGQKYKRCHKPREAELRLEEGTVSPMRDVPEDIERPPYAASGDPGPKVEPLVKSADVIERMRRAGKLAKDVLQETAAAIAPGVTTDELDAIAHEAHVVRGVYPSPLNYRGFPKSICTSVNEAICHGIPDDRPLRDGDILNLDITVYVDGVHGDTNATFPVGTVDAGSRKLIQTTRECLERGIAAVAPGRPMSEIGKAIESHADRHGFSVVRVFGGHGIGEQFHGDFIPLYHEPRATDPFEPGMVFTIEPMLTMGSYRERIWDNGWTAVTADGLRSAQFEHTILVTDDGVEVLTA
jgi:methionyl aminopeptidase